MAKLKPRREVYAGTLDTHAHRRSVTADTARIPACPYCGALDRREVTAEEWDGTGGSAPLAYRFGGREGVVALYTRWRRPALGALPTLMTICPQCETVSLIDKPAGN